MHKVLVNRLGGLSLPRKSVVRLTDRPNMTLDVYCERKTTTIKSSISRQGPRNDINTFASYARHVMGNFNSCNNTVSNKALYLLLVCLFHDIPQPFYEIKHVSV